jgi:predicted SnoaL-like aldol condensation-catalyzing enzyme
MGSRKAAAIDFLQLAATGRAREAFDKHAAPDFRHHNPWFKGDAVSLMTAMDENASKNPGKTLRVHHALEDGDLVSVYSEVHHRSGDRGAAVVHIFRFEGGRIGELWDVGQEVPENPVNENGIF